MRHRQINIISKDITFIAAHLKSKYISSQANSIFTLAAMLNHRYEANALT